MSKRDMGDVQGSLKTALEEQLFLL